MAAMTLYAQEKVQNFLLRSTPLTPPATWYLALFSTAQDPSETATEVVDANYTRQTVAWNAWAAGSNTNNGAVTFALAGLAGAITVAAVGLMDFPSGGNCWEYDNLTPAVSFSAGQSPRIPDAGATDTLT